MNTLYLDAQWDLTVDADGNIAMATDPYSLAQDAASAIQTYLGEVYFNTKIGIPYSAQILGQGFPLELYRAQCVKAAMTVPGVKNASVFFTGFQDRVLTGQVQVTTQSGAVIAVAINQTNSNVFTLNQSDLDGQQLLGY